MTPLDDVAPRARFLGNGRYSVMITAAGAGYSRWQDHLLTAWTADRTEEPGGLLLYLRDLDSGEHWSVGYQPARNSRVRHAAHGEPGRMTLAADHAEIEARLDVCVAADADAEIRRLAVRNASARHRHIEVTSCVEVVLYPAAAHVAHPAFAKLFVQTEFDAATGALLARRRPRSAGEAHPWLLHALIGDGSPQHETDRARFLGRGRSLRAPAALISTMPLSGTTESVLDPVLSLRRCLSLAPGASADLVFLLACAATRDRVLETARLLSGGGAVDGAFAGAAERERTRLVELSLAGDEAAALQEIAAAILYGHPALRANQSILRRAAGSPSRLAARGLGGPAPLVVLEVGAERELGAIEDLRRWRRYWSEIGFDTRFGIICPAPLAATTQVAAVAGDVGTAVLSDLAEAEKDLSRACASLYLDGSSVPAAADAGPDSGLRARLLGQLRPSAPPRPPHAPATRRAPDRAGAAPPSGEFEHGFSPDGEEYVQRLYPASGALPPMPWINVIANEHFGSLVSETGAAYTWSRNSRENRLTPWSNDPIRDPHGEALYLRDDDSGDHWSPLPGPCPAGSYEVRHGFGWSRWKHASHDLDQEVRVFVPRHDAVKVASVRLTNRAAHGRRLSLYSYARLVLGVLPEEGGRFVVTGRDETSGALFARNALNEEFAGAVVFAAAALDRDNAAPTAVEYTCDRTAFVGRGRGAENPVAVEEGGPLDARSGAGLDPCAALRLPLELAPGEGVACTFLLGEAADEETARRMVARYATRGEVERAFEEVRAFWGETLFAVQVRTPSAAIDRLLNGWLLYQVLACRLWARSAFYQSGGAVGFRDQLQDSAAFVLTRPEITKAQILLHAAHQFQEGDVLHWWHPPLGRGIRTRFADDLNWLPWITATYVRATGDWSILDEQARFVTARALEPGEDEAYLVPADSGERADVYEHCCRALDRSLTEGPHGLPLFGTGDWNDGMNRVGREGRGESVWMAFFLHRVILDFAPLCERRGDGARLERYRAYQRRLESALAGSAWDGEWYRRGYYDDGSTLGSAADPECRIDALALAWSVLSGAVPRQRAEQAMDAAERHLVDRSAGLIRLLTPPFDRDRRDPGYIKGYVPGIRENGGQYTHAAVWVVQAMAELGWRDRAAATLEMLAPMLHAGTPGALGVYQVEPYVVAADVYGVAPHVGRGGWTWYTGSAGWMHRIALGSILGLSVEAGTTLVAAPCIPDDWPGFSVELRFFGGAAHYDIEVRNPDGRAAAVAGASLDGQPVPVEPAGARLPLLRDGRRHRVVVTLGERPPLTGASA